jgi:hypothetical protein
MDSVSRPSLNGLHCALFDHDEADGPNLAAKTLCTLCVLPKSTPAKWLRVLYVRSCVRCVVNVVLNLQL